SPDGYIHRGHAYLIDGDGSAAMRDFNAALKIDPKCGVAYLGKSRAYQCLHNFAAAFAELEKAGQLGPEAVKTAALWESAFLNRELKQYKISLLQFDTLLKTRKLDRYDKAFAYFQRGECLVRTNNFAAGVKDLDAALLLEPIMVNARLTRARTLAGLRKPKES